MTPQIELAADTLFASDFRIERLLGQGGMGAVYVAHQLSTGRERALKVMHPSLVRDETMRRRFEQEAKVGSRIKSEHVVQVIAAGIDSSTGMPFIAMELLEGEDLESYVTRHGHLSPHEVDEIFGQLCHALAAAHAVGVVHRDLKPENVFLSRAHREGAPVLVKLLDLGIAKLVAESMPSDTAAIGTPLWMAPEQTGGKVGPQTDVWALGLLAFWMLTGRHYWRAAGTTTQHALMSVLREIVVEPLEPASLRAAPMGCANLLPAGFDAWFARCVAREAEARFRDAGEARVELSGVFLGSSATALLSGSALRPVIEAATGAPAATRSERTATRTSSGALAPTAATQAAVHPPKRSSKLLAIAAAAAAAIAAVAVFAARKPAAVGSAAPAVAASASASVAAASPATASAALPAASSANVLFDTEDRKTVWKIPVGDSPQRGPGDALVTIIEFGNFQCPFSKGVEQNLRKLLDEFPTARLVWKDDPLAIHSQAEAASQLAREARAEKSDDGFWAAHDLLIDTEFKPTPDALIDAAKKLGLDVHEAARAISERRHFAAIYADADLADDFQVSGTPYFFMNGRRMKASPALSELRTEIAAEVKRVEALVKAGTPKQGLYEHLIADGRGVLPLEVRTLPAIDIQDPGRGAAKPRVMLMEMCNYTHFMCRLVEPTIDRLLAEHKDELGISWLDFPDEKSEESRRASLAARVVFRQKGTDAYDKMRRLLLGAQKEPGGHSKYAVESYAKSVGFERIAFRNALEDPAVWGEIERDMNRIRSAGIPEPPGFLVCRPDFCTTGGYYLSSGHPARAFEKRIKLVLEAGYGPLPRAATPNAH